MTREPIPLSVGQVLEPRNIGPITQTDIVRFAGAGGDFNPLHHDPEYAERAGLSGPISMGQMQAAMLAAWLADTVHVEHIVSFAVRFSSPLHIGETLRLGGQVDALTTADENADRDSADRVSAVAELSLYATSGDRTVVTGRARVRTQPTADS